MNAPFDNPILYLVFALLGWGSVIELCNMGFQIIYDKIPAENSKRRDELFGYLAILLGILLVLMPFIPEHAPGFAMSFLIVRLLYRRVPIEFDDTGRPAQFRWLIRFGLLELLGSTLVIGATMGWYMR